MGQERGPAWCGSWRLCSQAGPETAVDGPGARPRVVWSVEALQSGWSGDCGGAGGSGREKGTWKDCVMALDCWSASWDEP